MLFAHSHRSSLLLCVLPVVLGVLVTFHGVSVDASGLGLSSLNAELYRRKFWLDTDIGGDIDDLSSLRMLLHDPTIDLLGVSTVNNKPVEKALIARLILRDAGRDDVPVYAGLGSEEMSNEDFLKYNPAWPKSKFGVPEPNDQFPRQMYQGQGRAYQQSLRRMDPASDLTSTRIRDLFVALTRAVQAAKRDNDVLTIVSIGPMNNLAAWLRHLEPRLARHVAIWHMGGWFSNPDGSVQRAGYNSGISPGSTKTVFNSQAKVIIVGSGLVQETGIEITKELRAQLVRPNRDDPPLVKQVKQDWNNWFRAFPFRIHFADVLTTYLALRRTFVTEMQTYSVEVEHHKHHSQYEPAGFMVTDKPIIRAESSIQKMLDEFSVDYELPQELTEGALSADGKQVDERGRVHMVMDYNSPTRALIDILKDIHAFLQQSAD